MSFWSRSIFSRTRSFTGPIDSPSPMISVVTPWRISLCEWPSAISDSVDHESMLMKPGATARPCASITAFASAVLEIAHAGDAIAAQRHVRLPPFAAGAVVNRAAL